MDDASQPNGISAWLRHAVEVAEVVNKIGLPLVLLALVTASYFGWILSPFSGIPKALQTHDDRMISLLESKDRLDAQVLATLVAMRADMARNSTAYRIRICSEIRDPESRRRCIDT